MGFLSNPLNSFAFHRTCLSRKLQSSSCYSSSGIWVSVNEFHSGNSNRKISTFPPLCMGRRSCKIAGRKTAQDAKKTKLYLKIGKEVVSVLFGAVADLRLVVGYIDGWPGTMVVLKGGVSPVSNTALAALSEKAMELDVPKEIIDCNIKRSSEKGQEAYIEKVYEVVNDCGGKMADPGSISFKFKRARAVNVKVTDADRYQILSVALDAGADDVIEPSVDEDDPEEEMNERCFKIVSSSENYPTILAKRREEGITFEPDNGFELLPLTVIEVDDEAVDLNKELMSKLLELDDVDAVYADQK